MFPSLSLSHTQVEPYQPLEFTTYGMLERIAILVQQQDFCNGDSDIQWPPLSSMKVTMVTHYKKTIKSKR